MARLRSSIVVLTIFFILPVMLAGFAYASPQGILIVKFEGTISTMSTELLKEALNHAEANNQPVILVLNTPGGSLDSTFEVIELIEASKVPVVGYVYPSGAKAWSAGTYILLSTHVAAMAPHTIIGSCQPVALSFGGSEPVNDTKTINTLTAFLVEKARMHGRNETIVKLFVKENLNLNAEEAKAYCVVEVVAASIPELLEKIDGLTISATHGEFTINSRKAEVAYWSPSLRILILKTISEPMIAYLMLMIGIYALVFGLSSPGVGGEVVGGIFIILGLIGLGMIRDVNLGALILIGLGALLLLYELFTPGFGIMGGAGLVSALMGSLLLFPRQWIVSPEWLNTLYLTSIIVPLIFGGFLIFVAYKVIKARRRPPFLGGVIGDEGEVVEKITPEKEGFILYKGEYWKAKSNENLKPKQAVVITGKEGPILVVRAKERNEKWETAVS